MLGFGAISESPISAIPDEIRFEVDRPHAGSTILTVSALFGDALIRYFQQNPEELKKMPRRKFEELVAELFNGFGYEVELTKQTRDGGKDIIAVKRIDTIDVKYLVECKRPDPGNPVAVGAVRELLGVKTDEGASKAILVTTTYFSPDAKQLFDRHRWELEPKVYDDLVVWLAEYLRLTQGQGKIA
jgi:predicted Mrr-cat superfamily restriction endonuclease